MLSVSDDELLESAETTIRLFLVPPSIGRSKA